MEDNIFDKVHEVDLEKTMKDSYIDYAMSVIASRALPDVRDGLKPVQRRVLYSMIELNNGPDKPHRKCARIVGDTMGKYHPHGDSSIYGALVNMAQEWSTRYPLVDGHGNFGSVDGDGAAAMRYTEARLSKISMEMLADINKDTVDFALNNEGWKETKDKDGKEVIFKIKERTIPRTASSYGDVDNSKHSGTYNERQVFIWSKKYSERAKHDRQKAISKALDAVGKKSIDYKDSTYGKNKYLTKKPLKDGETVDADAFEYVFDDKKLKEDEKLDGYYIICTNVVGAEKINEDYSPDKCWYKDGFLTFNREVPAEEIVDIYGGLWKIEETFKVSKTGMLNLRPIFHSKQDRIRAHFLLCFISLVIERLLEYRMNGKYSSKQIQKSLSSFSAVQMDGSNIYQIYYYDIVIKDIFNNLGINVNKKFLLQSDIRRIVGKTKKKVYEL